MQKILTLLVLCIICLKPALGQTSTKKAYESNTHLITAGAGIVNLWKTFLDKVVDIPEYKVKSSGAFSLVYEYGITDRFSAGLSGSYSRVNGKAEKYQIADQLTFISVLARANYHIYTSEKFDPYFGGGIGFKKSKYENKDPATVFDDANSKVPGTFDFSAQFGVKYFPLKNFGLCVEVGYIGGAVALIGMCGKF